jgi:hypothetical protein
MQDRKIQEESNFDSSAKHILLGMAAGAVLTPLLIYNWIGTTQLAATLFSKMLPSYIIGGAKIGGISVAAVKVANYAINKTCNTKAVESSKSEPKQYSLGKRSIFSIPVELRKHYGQSPKQNDQLDDKNLASYSKQNK